jgi:RNA polymerase sigma-70 factor (ECF subfamily)
MKMILFLFAAVEDRDKFELIFNKYKNLMLYKAYDILKDYALAEDAASEAFLRIFKNLHKIEDPASPQTAAFVVTIVRNTALTMLSREKGNPADEIPEEHSDGFDLEGDALSRLASDQIYRLVDVLGEELKGVFLLKYAYDLSHKEIGKTLGITENNVTVRLHRAKKKLQVLLREEGYVDAKRT